MTLQDLPVLNAILNATCTVLLLAGFAAIKLGKRDLHRNLMLLAVAVSAAFLTSYLIYHFNTGSKHFEGTGWTRPVYFTILISHTILAVVNLPLLGMTLWRAFKQDWERHKKIAKICFPVWLYISITGVVVYMMLYQWFAV